MELGPQRSRVPVTYMEQTHKIMLSTHSSCIFVSSFTFTKMAWPCVARKLTGDTWTVSNMSSLLHMMFLSWIIGIFGKWILEYDYKIFSFWPDSWNEGNLIKLLYFCSAASFTYLRSARVVWWLETWTWDREVAGSMLARFYELALHRCASKIWVPCRDLNILEPFILSRGLVIIVNLMLVYCSHQQINWLLSENGVTYAWNIISKDKLKINTCSYN